MNQPSTTTADRIEPSDWSETKTRFNYRPKRLLVIAIAFIIALLPNELGEVTRTSLIDAYVQVSVFVAATLAIFYGLETLLKLDTGALMNRARHWQVPIAAVFGAMPGCGGAVIVITAYSRGKIGFGAVVATLTSTMGDAAFLLIAKRPEVGLTVIAISLVVGVISGWLVDLIHRNPIETRSKLALDPARIGALRWRDRVFAFLAIPGLIMGIMLLVQVDPAESFGFFYSMICLTGAFLCFFVWAVSPVKAVSNDKDHPLSRMTEETSFVSIWVAAAYLSYEYLYAFAGLDLAEITSAIAIWIPLLAVLIGFIPGCGPQILITTMYINGIIPFAALIGNAISNDGDALFPAIALNPRSAIIATLYSAIPATLVAYGFFFFAPDFFNARP